MAGKPIPQRIPKHGKGKLNVGGTFPGAGRPKDEWKAMLRAMASAQSTMDGLVSILNDPTHPHYLKALEFAAERGYGKEAQTVEGDMRLTVVLRDE